MKAERRSDKPVGPRFTFKRRESCGSIALEPEVAVVQLPVVPGGVIAIGDGANRVTVVAAYTRCGFEPDRPFRIFQNVPHLVISEPFLLCVQRENMPIKPVYTFAVCAEPVPAPCILMDGADYRVGIELLREG